MGVILTVPLHWKRIRPAGSGHGNVNVAHRSAATGRPPNFVSRGFIVESFVDCHAVQHSYSLLIVSLHIFRSPQHAADLFGEVMKMHSRCLPLRRLPHLKEQIGEHARLLSAYTHPTCPEVAHPAPLHG